MAYRQYKRGQTIGRFASYLYDGYRIFNSDHWTFGNSRVMSGLTTVAEIMNMADPDDPPLFNFVGEYAYYNDIQRQKRLEHRKVEIREIVADGFEKYRDVDEKFIQARRDYQFHKQFDFDTAIQKALDARLAMDMRERELKDRFDALAVNVNQEAHESPATAG